MDKTPESQAIKAKIDKWYYIRLSSFCTAKETLKRPLREWEKIFVKYTSDKGLVIPIQDKQEKLKNCNNSKMSYPVNPVMKWVKHMRRHFSKD